MYRATGIRGPRATQLLQLLEDPGIRLPLALARPCQSGGMPRAAEDKEERDYPWSKWFGCKVGACPRNVASVRG